MSGQVHIVEVGPRDGLQNSRNIAWWREASVGKTD